MKPRLLDWLVCPLCRSDLAFRDAAGRPPVPSDEVSPPSECVSCRAPADAARRDGGSGNCESCYGLEVESGSVVCPSGHGFPVVGGVPRLLPDFLLESATASRSISASFSREWAHFDYDADRTWGQSVRQRAQDFLRHVDHSADSLRGKLVLDAGCGNGALSRAITSFGCEVVATDISTSVEAAHRHFAAQGNDRTHFIQSDLMHLALRPATFDVIFCAGVLHHTPSTRGTLEELLRALAPGGTVFIWLYWRVPGLRPMVSEGLRRAISPLPAPLKHGAVWALAPQSMLRQRIRELRGRSDPSERLNHRETMVRMLDSYTPRYRWRHTPAEVHGWFGELGFTDIKTTEEGVEGFGVVARKPPLASSESAQVAGSVSAG
jgi:ubiquinone/menaquinone biosynthesis C-methylase UbiE/uncharacterized protein YbaR (Trm112 family)